MTELNINEIIALNEDDEQQITDLGMSLLLVGTFGHLIRYAVDTGKWFIWTGGRWEEDSEQNVKVFALTQAAIRAKREEVLTWDDENNARQRGLQQVTSFEGVKKRTAIITTTAADPRVQVYEEDFDAALNEIVAGDRVINLDTLEVRRGQPSDMNARSCGVSYDAGATSPLLDQYLETFLPEPEDQRFVFALLGNALRVGNRSRTLPIFWGDSTSGKSQLFAALHKALGSYICTVSSSIFRGNLDDKPRPDLVAAMYTRIAYASEASKSWALHADQIKRLTGGDALPYRNLYRGVVNKIPRFTPMLVTNVMPRITGADGPTKRRIIVVHFDQSLDPEREDPRIKERFLTDERTLQALLARVVAGAADDILQDITRVPKRFTLATMSARGDVDHTDEFITWIKEEGYLTTVEGVAASQCVKASDLHALYTHWLRKYGDDIDKKDTLSLKALNTALREKGWESALSAGTRWVGQKLAENLPLWVRM